LHFTPSNWKLIQWFCCPPSGAESLACPPDSQSRFQFAVVEKIAHCKPTTYLGNLDRRPGKLTDIFEGSIALIQKQ